MDSKEKLMNSGILDKPSKVSPAPRKSVGRVGRPGYSEEFKIRALLLLQQNEYHMSNTAKQLHVSHKQLAIWRDTMGIPVFRENDKQTQVMGKEHLAVIVAKAKVDIGELTSRIFENASSAEIEVIKRIREVVETSTNLDHLTRCLKVLHEIVTGPKDEAPAVTQHVNSYNQLVMSQIIKVQEDLEWKINLEQDQLNQSKSLPPSPSQG